MSFAEWHRMGNLALDRRIERLVIAGALEGKEAIRDYKDEMLFGADLEWRRAMRRASKNAQEMFSKKRR